MEDLRVTAVIDICGERFGRLVVVSRAGSKSGKAAWRCSCECGNEINVPGKDLRSGNTRSCGCLLREVRIEAGHANTKHGAAKARGKTYMVWCSMRRRCNSPAHKSWPNYGGRGIAVCARWEEFANFVKDMGEAPDGMSIERIDNNGHYEPGNCRWATLTEQARNRRSNIAITAFGETKLVCEWAEDARCQVSLDAFAKRLENGWPAERAITEPKYQSRRMHRAGRIEPTGRTVASTSGRQEREWRVVAA